MTTNAPPTSISDFKDTMNSPLSTPVRQAKLGIASRSLPLTSEFKRLLNEQHQRLATKHQQDLDLVEEIRGYVKCRLALERDYTNGLAKLAKQHQSIIGKKFTLLTQCDEDIANIVQEHKQPPQEGEEPRKSSTLYRVWAEHIARLQANTRARAEQFEQLQMVSDKLKEIRNHKSTIGKKCLESHLRKVHEDILLSIVDVDRTKKLYHEDESQARKARETEEKFKKKRSGLLTKLTGDLQAKKEKSSAQREANDIQSTQARNDYIMALAAANAHLEHYYQRELEDFIGLIDDGVLDYVKQLMATLFDCDISVTRGFLASGQFVNKMLQLTDSKRTNSIFLDTQQSACLRGYDQQGALRLRLEFEPCNEDRVHSISLEHNADYALQHEIDKWFAWFKKECRNLSQLMHQLDTVQRALAEGRRSVELPSGQQVAGDDLEAKCIELKQLIRKSEAAKLKAQARLKVIKEGGMDIDEWSSVELEIRADMARMQEEAARRRQQDAEAASKRVASAEEGGQAGGDAEGERGAQYREQPPNVRVSKDSTDTERDYEEGGAQGHLQAQLSDHQLAQVSPSNSNIGANQRPGGYSALADPALAWQDDYASAWDNVGNQQQADAHGKAGDPSKGDESSAANTRYNLLSAEPQHHHHNSHNSNNHSANQDFAQHSTTVQSSSPLSAIVDGMQSASSPYAGAMSEAYKSDFECDYNRNTWSHNNNANLNNGQGASQGGQQRADASAASSADPYGYSALPSEGDMNQADEQLEQPPSVDVNQMLNRRVEAMYQFDKSNEDDLAFNEGDRMLVIEISDADWVKARHEATLEEGFIPTSYVRSVDDEEDEDRQDEQQQSYNNQAGDFEAPTSETGHQTITNVNETGADVGDSTQQETLYRAAYDYQPEAGACDEADGLPMLALTRGELFKVIEYDEHDGYWLVERESGGERGHVSSMLLEALGGEGTDEADDDDHEGDYDDEQDDGYEGADDYEPQEPPGLPAFEPPPPPPPPVEVEEPPQVDARPEVPSEFPHPPTPLDDADDSQVTTTTSNTKQPATDSLVPTSFIIIEPTPEVESRSIEASLAAGELGEGAEERDEAPTQPAGYAVVNENFAFEALDRQANDELEQPEGDQDPEQQDQDIPEPPAVFVDQYDDDNDHRSSDDDQNEELEVEQQADEASATRTQATPGPRSPTSTNVDVNPIVRHRADEFSRQIIDEAVSFLYGSLAAANKV